MSYSDSDDYLDSTNIEEFEIRSDALSPALKAEFNYELQYTHASRFLSEEVVIINWEEWKQFCRFLPERRRTEAEKEQQNSNLIPNSNLVSRLDYLDTKLDTILQEQSKEMKEKDRKSCQLIQELTKTFKTVIWNKNSIRKRWRTKTSRRNWKKLQYWNRSNDCCTRFKIRRAGRRNNHRILEIELQNQQHQR